MAPALASGTRLRLGTEEMVRMGRQRCQPDFPWRVTDGALWRAPRSFGGDCQAGLNTFMLTF
jgi:hypothetical protein